MSNGITGPLRLYDTALHRLAKGSLRLPTVRLAALLLGGSYSPDQSGHTALSDIVSHEISGGDYTRLQLGGARVLLAPGTARFTSDALAWGDPVHMPPVRFMALVEGLVAQLSPTSPLIAVVDLRPGGGAVESQRGAFTLAPPADGWFEISAQNT